MANPASPANTSHPVNTMQPPQLPPPPTSPPPPRPTIAIIGAGLASLRLAHLLLTSTPHPTPCIKIFEARSRVGGRLHQSRCGDGEGDGGAAHRDTGAAAAVVDMGPNWIHGTEGNPMVELARRTGTLTMEPPTEDVNEVFDREGQRLGREEAGFVSEEVWGEISGAMRRSKVAARARVGVGVPGGDRHGGGGDEEKADEEGEEEGGEEGKESDIDIDHDLGLGEVLASALLEKSRQGQGRWGQGTKSEQEKRLRDAIEETRLWGPFVGEPVESQSYRFFYMEECVDGGNVFVASTYKKILEHLARPVLEAGVVQFEKEVVKVQVLEGDQGVSVGLKSGEEEVFDEVICTAPLGWLKRNEERVFEPRLPQTVRTAIAGLGYGRLEKVYVTFPEAWWVDGGGESAADDIAGHAGRGDESQGGSLWSNGEVNNPTQHAHKTTRAADNPNRSLGIFTHIHAPRDPSSLSTNSPTTSPPTTNLSLVSLAHLPPSCAHPTLLAYLYGDTSTALVSSLRDVPDHTSQYRDTLWRFIEPYLRILPGYVPGARKCVPVENGIVATRWQDDEFAGRGSYTCFLKGGGSGEQGNLERMVGVLRGGEGMTKEDDGRREKDGDSGGVDGARGGEGETIGGSRPRSGGVWFAGEHVSPLEGLGTTTGAYWSGEAVAQRLARKWGFDVVVERG